MRTTPSEDLTARARIRDAAIDCFAQSGFRASLRTIAARAGVSPGLITHHFGTKARLRAECDAEVLRRYRAVERESLPDVRAALAGFLADPDQNADLVAYMLRALQVGGPSARRFLESVVDVVRGAMEQGVKTGIVRPSRDEEARARYLTYQGMGTMLVEFLAEPVGSVQQLVRSLADRESRLLLPLLELYTEGVFADRSLLDDYARGAWPGHADEAGERRPRGKESL